MIYGLVLSDTAPIGTAVGGSSGLDEWTKTVLTLRLYKHVKTKKKRKRNSKNREKFVYFWLYVIILGCILELIRGSEVVVFFEQARAGLLIGFSI